MKIVQIMPEFGLAGAEIMCENLTYELIKQGHSVTVISMYDYHSAITERLEKAGADVRYLDKKPGLDFSMINKMKKIFKEVKADVIHTHRYVMQYAVPAAVMAGVKRRVHTVHSVARKENDKPARILNRFFYKFLGVTPVALSERIRETIIDEYKIDKSKIPVVLNGIDLSKCKPKEDYSVNGNFKILHIGRFSAVKNHIGLLEAFKIFHDKHPGSELWLIGDGDEKVNIEKYVAANSLSENVKFLGLRTDTFGFLHDADIFALPSNYEGIPMTLIEAMGTALPIVATAVGGVPDMLDENSAILTKVDSRGIAEAFGRYCCDSSLRKSHGMAAKVLSDKFSAKTMADKYIEIYR